MSGFSGRILQTRIVGFTHNLASAGSQAITGVGFKPRIVRVRGGIHASNWICFGGVDAALTMKAMAQYTASGGFALYDNVFIRVFTDATTGNIADAIVASLDGDGLTLTWSVTAGSPTGTGTFQAECEG